MWTDHLENDVATRLANCNSLKIDIIPLTDAKWAAMKEAGKDKQGFTKEDALVAVLELLDSNGQCFDLTTDEYNEIIKTDKFEINDLEHLLIVFGAEKPFDSNGKLTDDGNNAYNKLRQTLCFLEQSGVIVNHFKEDLLDKIINENY